jgi:hypothetical protein
MSGMFRAVSLTALKSFLLSSAADAGAAAVAFVHTATGAVARTVRARLSDTVSLKDFGAVGDGVAIDTAAILAALASGVKDLDVPPGTYLIDQQIAVNGVRLRGRKAQWKFTAIAAGVDCLVLQGSSASNPLVFDGININANGCGRDAVVLSGGTAGSASADFEKLANLEITGAVRDGIHLEPAAASYWIENLRLNSVKVTSPGRHGLACIVPDLANVFVNKVSLYDFEVRGAGQTTAGWDIFVDLQGNSGQKASEWTFINPELDAAGAANHSQASVRIQRSGTTGSAHSWTFIGGTFEDTGTVITGFPKAVSLGASGLAEGLVCKGGVIVGYGGFADDTLFTNLDVFQSSSGRNLTKTDGKLEATNLVAASAGSAGAPAISVDGDSDTGAFFPAANTYAVATGGTERTRVTSSGFQVNAGFLRSVGSDLQTICTLSATSFNETQLQAYHPTGGQLVLFTANTSGTNQDWLRILASGDVMHRQNSTKVIDLNSHLCLRSYTVATLPSAAGSIRMIAVSDGTSNKRLAVSDGTNWRWPDGAIVS